MHSIGIDQMCFILEIELWVTSTYTFVVYAVFSNPETHQSYLRFPI
jgi:hypothetical protein